MAGDPDDQSEELLHVCLHGFCSRDGNGKLTQTYREYLKREDQVMVFRQQQEENAKAALQQAKDKSIANANGYGDVMDVDQEDEKEEEMLGSKVVVIHPGSQNLRIGLASDALPKTIPMVIARRSDEAEFEIEPPYPKRQKMEAGDNDEDDEDEEEHMFGQEFASHLHEISTDLKQRMRINKRRILPNSKDLVISYNNRTAAEVVKEHNDPNRVEWTEVPPDSPPEYFVGKEALRIPDTSSQRYRLVWPLRCGWLNEKDYRSKRRLFEDISVILEEALNRELGIVKKDIQGVYSAVLVVPDLYEKVYVNEMLELLFKDFFFQQVCIIQVSTFFDCCMSTSFLTSHGCSGIFSCELWRWIFSSVHCGHWGTKDLSLLCGGGHVCR